jgi:glucose-1-phosphate cytidylyltransferase
MIEIGGKPIIWHIMKIYSFYGIREFVICAGYKQEVIKDYFANYSLYNSDVTFDFSNGAKPTVHSDVSEHWRVTVVDTGLSTMTGGRIKRIKDYVGGETFCMTYGDGVSDIDIGKEIGFHNSSGLVATMAAVQPEGRFGMIDFGPNDRVDAFREKDRNDSGWINGGFMVLEPKIFDLIDGDDTVFEKEPLARCIAMGQLNAYRHYGFWQCMDTMRDKEKLDSLWGSGEAPWKIW